MISVRVKKVSVLQGRPWTKAMNMGLDDNDLVIVRTKFSKNGGLQYELEKIEGDPVSYLLNKAFSQ